MTLLNGVPPIIGVGLLHITLINVLAITFEYFYLKKKLSPNYLLPKVVIANLLSLAVGLLLMLTLSDLLPGNITKLGMEFYSLEDRLAMIPSLLGLVLTNIVLEIPVYLVRKHPGFKVTVAHVTIANLLTNIPVVILYGILAI